MRDRIRQLVYEHNRKIEEREPFPDKPKGMHWGTDERLWGEHHEAEMEQFVRMRKVDRQARKELS